MLIPRPTPAGVSILNTPVRKRKIDWMMILAIVATGTCVALLFCAFVVACFFASADMLGIK